MGDYSWIGPVVQGAASAVSAGQRNGAADQNSELQRDAYMRALAMLQGGQLSYDPQQASMTGPSAMGGVMGDPSSQIAEQSALQRLQGAATSGYDTIDRAAINRTMSDVNANEQGQREAALARLDPNSGAALAASMSAQSTGANRANQQGMDIAAASRKRALDAMGAYGNMASQMRGEAFGEQSKRAEAQDAISKFNAETSRFNAGQANTAHQNNIGNQLGALGVASGAGGTYGQSLVNAANTRAQGNYGIAKQVAGGANAYGENQGGGSNYDDLYGNRGGYTDISKDDEEK